ncbi:hypothetical protein STCU_11280 [Strigomonas culicis]|uniref:Uncharacterized protein n=1 Tax=Strigomonas culicis TaxID=28005 RepID=S9TEE7_9TRYP|nr:hypothetical protein STCU_11280 [Strigomonas culicis]|eukprot:EPY16427.1 hypothetical protein STCU_11280 [Strigomonas culicis]
MANARATSREDVVNFVTAPQEADWATIDWINSHTEAAEREALQRRHGVSTLLGAGQSLRRTARAFSSRWCAGSCWAASACSATRVRTG